MLHWFSMTNINRHSSINCTFSDFLFLFKGFELYSILLFFSSQKLTIRLKYGLYHYFFWLKVGCKNIMWRRLFTVYFLLDFIFSSMISSNIYNFLVTTIKYNYLPIKRFIFTISKGPMVRKKQSREQYVFKQIFINVKQIVHFVNKKSLVKLIDSRGKVYDLNISKLFWIIRNDCIKSMHSVFIFSNFDINFFNVWLNNFKIFNFFIETNLFFLKKIVLITALNDICFFHV